ncbi:MAG: hypothetical protein ACK559_22370, partial [bacterium]
MTELPAGPASHRAATPASAPQETASGSSSRSARPSQPGSSSPASSRASAPARSSTWVADALADFNQVDWSIEQALDGQDSTAWGIHPQEGMPHEAVFVLRDPIRLS